MTKLLFYHLYKERFVFSLNTTFKFVAIGVLWVVFSDLALFILHLPGMHNFSSFQFEVLKGLCFVMVMGVVFFFTLQRHRKVYGDIDMLGFFRKHPHPMWIYNLDTLQFIEVNESAIHTYGYSRKEFLSMTILDIRPAEELPRLRDAVIQVQTGYRLLGQWKHLRKDGTLLHAEVSTYSMFFNNQHAALTLSHDISNLVKAEEELKQVSAIIEKKVSDKTLHLALMNKELEMRNREVSATNNDLIELNDLLLNTNKRFIMKSSMAINQKTEQLKRMLEQVSDGVWSFDVTGKDENYVSHAALELFGLTEEEIINCPNFWQRYIHPDDRACIDETLKALEVKGQVEFSYRFARAAQPQKTIHQQIRIIHDEEGTPIRLETIATANQC